VTRSGSSRGWAHGHVAFAAEGGERDGDDDEIQDRREQHAGNRLPLGVTLRVKVERQIRETEEQPRGHAHLRRRACADDTDELEQGGGGKNEGRHGADELAERHGSSDTPILGHRAQPGCAGLVGNAAEVAGASTRCFAAAREALRRWRETERLRMAESLVVRRLWSYEPQKTPPRDFARQCSPRALQRRMSNHGRRRRRHRTRRRKDSGKRAVIAAIHEPRMDAG